MLCFGAAAFAIVPSQTGGTASFGIQAGFTSPAAIGPPEGALAFADFQNGYYFLDGATAAIGDIFDTGTFAAEALIAGQGLVANDAVPGVDPAFTAEALALFQGGATIVLEFDFNGRGDAAFAISKFGFGDNVYAHAASGSDWCEWIVQDDNGGLSVYENPNQNGSAEPQTLANGTHKMAVTVSPTKAAAAFPGGGSPATYEHTGRTFTWQASNLELGIAETGAIARMISVTIYPETATASLPGLIA